MELYCAYIVKAENRFVFQNTTPENGDHQRRQPRQSQSPRISSGEEARIIEEQGRIVGAQAGANLEQVILQEAENEMEARNLLEDPGRLLSFFRLQNQNHPLDRDGNNTYNSGPKLRELLNTVKHDAAFLKRLYEIYAGSDSVYGSAIMQYAIIHMNPDERFFQNVHRRWGDGPVGHAALSRIRDQSYLRNIPREERMTVEDISREIVDEFRRSPESERDGLRNIAVSALMNITDQTYLAGIATGRNEEFALRKIAISKLNDRRVLQTLINAGKRALATSVEETPLLTERQLEEIRRRNDEVDIQQELGECAVVRINELDNN